MAWFTSRGGRGQGDCRGAASRCPLLLLALIALVAACGPGAAPAAPAAAPARSPADSAPAAPAAQAPAAPAAPAPRTIEVSLPAQTALVAVLMMAELEGHFARHGVRMEYSLHQGGPPALQAMMAGAADLTLQISGTVLNAIQNGADIAIVASNQGDPDHQLFARPEIESVPALEGKRVAAADPGSELNTITGASWNTTGCPRTATTSSPSAPLTPATPR